MTEPLHLLLLEHTPVDVELCLAELKRPRCWVPPFGPPMKRILIVDVVDARSLAA